MQEMNLFTTLEEVALRVTLLTQIWIWTQFFYSLMKMTVNIVTFTISIETLYRLCSDLLEYECILSSKLEKKTF